MRIISRRNSLYLSAALCSTLSLPTLAFEFEKGGFTGTLNTTMSFGAAISTQRKHTGLIGKLNIEGQQALCDPGSTIEVLPVPIPDPIGACALSNFEEFINAEGSYLGHGFDDGRLNYDQHDLVAAAAKINIALAVSYGNFSFVASAIAISDPINTDFDETHPNNFSNGGAQPERTPRSKDAEDDAYSNIQLETAYLETTTEFANRTQSYRLGKQLTRQGESLLLIPNSLNTINAPDLVRLNTPGRELNEILDPTNQFVFNTGLTETISMTFNYLLDFQPLRVDPAGSFYSPADLLGAGSRETVSLGVGFAREDPGNLFDTPFDLLSLQSNAPDSSQFGRDCFAFRDGNDVNGDQFSNLNQGAHRGAVVEDVDHAGRPGLRAQGGLVPGAGEFLLDFTGGRQACFTSTREPDASGQWGLSFNFFTEILGGAEFNLFYLNYHSRLPYVSAYASQLPPAATQLPLGDLPIGDLTDLLGGIPVLGDILDGLGLDVLGNLEPLLNVIGGLKVADTVRLAVEYPEDIQSFGASISTNIGDYSVSAEYAYRPDLPLQVDTVELLFYSLSPAFGQSRCASIPTSIDQYRNDYDNYTPFDGRAGACDNSALAPGEYIKGYEEFPVGQGDVVILSLAETNPFLANSWIRILEVGFTKVFGLPDVDELQLSGGASQTNALPGRAQLDSNFDGARDDGGANGGDPNALAFLVLNPTQQDTKAFATSFSWGYRFLHILTYEQIFGGTVELTAGFFHDVNGTTPGPGTNFIEDRKQFLLSPAFKIGAWKFTGAYNWLTGAGIRNGARDRDTFALAVARTF